MNNCNWNELEKCECCWEIIDFFCTRRKLKKVELLNKINNENGMIRNNVEKMWIMLRNIDFFVLKNICQGI